MNKYFSLLLLLSSFTSYAQNADSTWIVNHYVKMERYLPMRDGIKLFTAIYVPKDTITKHPVLMTRTPYSCAPYGANNFRDFWNSYQKEYFREGYIMVIQDVRGRWMSEGNFVNVRPFISNKTGKETDEASDTYDAIDWLIKNIHGNNGKVGLFGISYPGFYSTMGAACNHPALKAVSPQAPVTNWFIGDDFHHKGAFFQMDAFDFYSALGSGFGVPHPKPVSEAPPPAGYPDHDNYRFYLQTGTLKNLSKYMGDTIAFWNDLMTHPVYDRWWQARDARRATRNIKPAMLWVGGLFDAEDCWGAWNAYKAAEKNNPGKAFNVIVEGPWYHEEWANHDGTHHGNIRFGSNTSTYYQQHFEIPFFNYFLKGEGDISRIGEANVFITGSNQWNTFSQWPPATREDIPIYPAAGGKLSWSRPSAVNSFSEYTSDPAKPVPYEEFVHFKRTRTYMTDDQRFAGRRPDVLVFQTEPLTGEVTLTGPITADLQTSISTTDADFLVKVIDVYPENAGYNQVDIYAEEDPVNPYPMGGYEMLVRAEIMRGKFRKSFEKPEPFVPGKITEVKWELPDVAHTFLKGHRIMIQVQSSWFPLVDRNPQKFTDIYQADESDFQKSAIRIYHDALHPSEIILPVLKK